MSDEKTIFQIGDNLSSRSGTRQGRIARGTGVNKPRTICQRKSGRKRGIGILDRVIDGCCARHFFSCHRHPIVALEEVASHRMNRWIMPLLALYTGIYRGTVVDVATTRKKFFNASSASDFRFRKNYLRILVFFFFFLLSFFFIIVVTWNRTFLLKVFGHVADFIAAEYVTNWKLGTAIRSCIIYIFISCAFKTYAITIICFRFNFSIKRQLIIQRMRPWSEKVCDINL